MRIPTRCCRPSSSVSANLLAQVFWSKLPPSGPCSWIEEIEKEVSPCWSQLSGVQKQQATNSSLKILLTHRSMNRRTFYKPCLHFISHTSCSTSCNDATAYCEQLHRCYRNPPVFNIPSSSCLEILKNKALLINACMFVFTFGISFFFKLQHLQY